MKKKPGIELAKNFILGQIQSGNYQKEKPLPSIRTLAKLADVSFVTMWKALTVLKNNGLIFSRAEKGKNYLNKQATSLNFDTELDEKHNSHSSDLHSRNPWQNTCLLLEKDILTGHFPPGSKLPSTKELQHLYNISFPTLKKALLSLEQDGIIQVSGRNFLVPHIATSNSRVNIAAVGCGTEDGKLWIDSIDKNYFRILENICIQSKIHLHMGVYHEKKSQIQFTQTNSRKPFDFQEGNYQGFICIIANLAIPPEKAIQALLPYNRPIAVFNVVGGLSLPATLLKNPLIQLYTVTSSKKPALQVSRYILQKGHREVAFFSPFHKALWSQTRESVIQETLTSSAVPCKFHSYTLKDYAYQWDFLRATQSTQVMSELQKEFETAMKEHDSPLWRKFGHFSYHISDYLTDWNCARGEIYHQMLDFFQKAINNKKITLWIASNDYTALLALHFLRSAKISVPEEIKLISFDNTKESMENQISSYDFNHAGLIQQALGNIFWGRRRKNQSIGKVIETEGSIIERQSTC